jgi:hypothetical protein
VNASLKSQEDILYRGFKNQVRFVTSEKDQNKYMLIGKGCMLTKQDNDYIVIPMNVDTVSLTIVQGGGGQEKKTLEVKKFKVMNVPDPSFYINGSIASSSSLRDAKYVEMKYVPEIPLIGTFQVLDWMMLIDGEVYTGNNKLITDQVAEKLQSVKDGTVVQLTISARGEDGIMRKYSEELTIGE